MFPLERCGDTKSTNPGKVHLILLVPHAQSKTPLSTKCTLEGSDQTFTYMAREIFTTKLEPSNATTKLHTPGLGFEESYSV